MKDFFRRNKINIIITLLFLLLPWLFFNDSIKIGSVIFGAGDPNYNTLPLWDLIVTSIKNGEFPFWNRYIYSGFPLFANPQTSILYPVLWPLYFIFPLSVAYNISILLHYSLAGIFTYIFLNRYKLDKLASFAGGLVFMFSGLLICHKGHAQMLYTLIWFPLILYFLDKYRESKRFEFVLAGSIFYSFSFFAGHPQIFLYGSMIILLYIIYYSLIYERRSFYFLYSAAIFIITALLISIQLFPTYELMNHSVRSSLDYGAFSFFSYSWRMLPTLISPFIYGAGPSGVGFFGAASYIETVAYFGITTLPLLIMGFFSKNRDKYFWIFILVFSFVLVLGMNTPFYKLMYHIPLYNKFRIPTRNWFEFGLALSILTGFGLDYFIKNFDKKVKKIIIVVISILGLVGIVLGFSNLLLKKLDTLNLFDGLVSLKEKIGPLLQTTGLSNYATYVPLIFITALIILLIFSIFKRNKLIYIFFIVLIFFDLRAFGNYVEGSSDASYINKDLKSYEEFSFMKSEAEPYRIYPVVDWGPQGATIYPSRNIHYGVDLFSGLDPLMLGDYSNFIGMFYMDNKENAEMLMRNNNILSILNTKYIIYFKPDNYDEFNKKVTKVFYKNSGNVTIDNSQASNRNEYKFNNYQAVYNKDVLILRNNDYLPRFYFTEKIRNVSDISESRSIIWETEAVWVEDRFDPKAETLVENSGSKTIEPNPGNSRIEIQEYTNNRAILNVSAESDTFLVFSDTYYPGWKAYVDGRQVEIYRANGIIKGIYVPQGEHIVKFTFLPNNFWIYFSISLITFAGVILSMAILKKIK